MPVINLSILDGNDDGNSANGDGTGWDAHLPPYINDLTFIVNDNPAGNLLGGLRFTGVTVDQGATINSATLTVELTPAGGAFESITVYGDDSDDAATWANSDPASITQTTANTVQTTNIGGSGARDVDIDVTAIVQEIVNRGGWSSGNAMRFTIEGFDAENYAAVEITDYATAPTDTTVATGTGKVGRLEIDYSTGAALSYEQEGYRWRDDDGSELTANWLQPQDTDINRGKEQNTRLRALVNITSDAPSNQATLQYRRVGDPDSEWETIL